MPVRTGEARLVAQTEDVLGEVPLWHPTKAILTWIDVLKPAFHSYDPATGRTQSWIPPEKLGSYALTASEDILISARSGMALWKPGGDSVQRLSHPEADRPDNILNDGRTDSRGRFLVGSMDKMLSGPNGRLWQISAERGTQLIQDSDIYLPNSICWSPDSSTFYLGDSHTNRIFAYDYNLETGQVSNRRLFAETKDLPGDVDGSSVDAEGYLWNARYDGGCLIRFSPDGKVDQIVELGVLKPTHVTFGGPNLKTMYVTTARFRLPADRLAAAPASGGVLAMEVDVAGLPEPLYG
jgi:sugar lactone lactonase YvrE